MRLTITYIASLHCYTGLCLMCITQVNVSFHIKPGVNSHGAIINKIKYKSNLNKITKQYVLSSEEFYYGWILPTH